MMQKMLTIILCCFSIATLSFADDKNTFENVTVGLSIKKPESWHFMSAELNQKNLEITNYKNEDIKKMVLKHSTVPLVAMMKHSESFDDVSPSLKISTKSFGKFQGLDPKKILEMISSKFKNMLDDYKMIVDPKEDKIGGKKSVYMMVNYSTTINDGRTFSITSEIWIVPRGSYFFMIGAGTREDEKTGSRAEIRKILDTIKIN